MASLVPRADHLQRLDRALRQFPVVAILGARQIGKTTLARQLADRFRGPVTWFDLENPDELMLLDDPMLALDPLEGLIVLDEIQRRADLFPVLRVLADRPEAPARFLILGSASPDLLRQSSESLAGRIYYHALEGFDLEEVGIEQLDVLWQRGGFPLSLLASNDEESLAWRESFILTFLERDLPTLGIRVPSETLYRFWSMLAHYHGQVWNGAELARAFGVSDPTVRRYLDTLTSALVLRQLQPWHENLAKRQVRSPKVYIADSGLLHALLRVGTHDELLRHPKVGASWEGFAIQQVLRRLRVGWHDANFWATHAGAELDLFVSSGSRLYGYEFKRTRAPRLTRSMRAAMTSLKLDRLDVIHAGEHTFPMAQGIRAVSLHHLFTELEPLR